MYRFKKSLKALLLIPYMVGYVILIIGFILALPIMLLINPHSIQFQGEGEKDEKTHD